MLASVARGVVGTAVAATFLAALLLFREGYGRTTLYANVRQPSPVAFEDDPTVVRPDIGFAQRGPSVWSRAFLGSGEAVDPPALAAASDGSVLLAASFGGGGMGDTIDLGAGTLASAGASDGVVAQLTSSGALVWSRVLGGPGDDRATAIAADGLGGVAVAGTYTDAVDLGAGRLPVASEPRPWLAVLDESGQMRWSRAFGQGTGGHATPTAVAFVRSAVIVLGTYEATIDIDGGELTSSGATDGFVAAFDDDRGHLLWAHSLGTPSQDEDMTLVARDDRALIAFTVGREPNPLSVRRPYLESDLVVLELDAATGVERWRHTFEGVSAALEARALALGDDGALYLAGTLIGPLAIGTTELTTAPGQAPDIFLARLEGGTVAWARTFGDEFLDDVHALASSGDRVYFSGVFRGTLDVGWPLESGQTSDGTASQDGYLAQVGSDGTPVGIRTMGGYRSNRGQSLVLGANDEIYASGRFSGAIDVGAGRLLSTQPFLDYYVARLAP
jgi:outer membrane protein assembly factor BamB